LLDFPAGPPKPFSFRKEKSFGIEDSKYLRQSLKTLGKEKIIMVMYMDRLEALNLLRENVHNENLIKHCIAVGAIMKGLAQKFGEDENLWELAGLLHDIDYEQTKDNHEKHGLVALEILKDKVPQEILDTIPTHNDLTGFKREKKIDFALSASDAISGLIIATALMMPSRKLEEVKPKSVLKKFKKKDFARNVSREKIMLCEKVGLSLEEFIDISLRSLQSVSDELGL